MTLIRPPATAHPAERLEHLVRHVAGHWDQSKPHGGLHDAESVEEWHAHFVSRARQLLHFLDCKRRFEETGEMTASKKSDRNF